MSYAIPRRALVLTDEKACHPFRRSLPPHVCATLVDASAKRSMRQVIVEDWRSALSAYCATFVAITLYIA